MGGRAHPTNLFANPDGCCDGCSGKVGAAVRLICCNFFTILYADRRIVPTVYLEDYEIKRCALASQQLHKTISKCELNFMFR